MDREARLCSSAEEAESPDSLCVDQSFGANIPRLRTRLPTRSAETKHGVRATTARRASRDEGFLNPGRPRPQLPVPFFLFLSRCRASGPERPPLRPTAGT